MSAYLKFIKQQHLKTIAYSPFQTFLMFIEPGHQGCEQDLGTLRRLFSDTHWCTSKYTKMVVKLSNQLFNSFQQKYLEEVPKLKHAQFKNTFFLFEQFLSTRELKDLCSDYLKIAQMTSDFFEYKHKEEKFDHVKIMEDLESFFGELPTFREPLSTLLSELPFQIFVNVAAADKNIDSKERARFLEIIKDLEWCQGDCTRILFTGTDYHFKEFLKQYVAGKIKKSIDKIKRTAQLMDRIFKQEETDLVKTDLLRLSTEVAKASGGLAGIASISRQERKVLNQLDKILVTTL